LGARALKLAIIGAGTAGLALAVSMAPQHKVTVFEKTPEPSPIGAGVLIQPSGLAVLRDMGLHDGLVQLGARIERLHGTLGTGPDRAWLQKPVLGNHFLKDGWPVMDMRYSAFQEGSFGLGLSRHALISALLGLALERGAQFLGAHDITHLTPGQGLEGFDLTVIANGSFSQLREQAGISSLLRPYPWGALWVLLKDPHHLVGPVLRQWYRGAHQMLGLMPTGFHRLEDQSSSALISLFWSVRADQYEALRSAPLLAWKKKVLALAPQAEFFLDQIHDWDQLAWARYADVRTTQPYQGKVICIGDAAHAMSPQLGQGSNMALMDAWCLAECLSSEDIESALPRYTALRRKHLAAYQFVSKWLTPMFQADGWLLPTLRNVSFWPGSRLPGSSKLAATLLTGYLLHPKGSSVARPKD
jgi:2-polyprenyl-6-methoxyphenol hydroxylase-like FAD-dependent oxidoreductase